MFKHCKEGYTRPEQGIHGGTGFCGMKSRCAATFSHGNRASTKRERAICSCIGFYWFALIALAIPTSSPFFEVVGVAMAKKKVELLLRVLPGERAATRLETTLRSQTRDPGVMFPFDGGSPFSGPPIEAPPFKGLWRPKVSMVVTTVSHCFSELSWMERDSTTTAMALLRARLEGVHGGQGVSKG